MELKKYIVSSSLASLLILAGISPEAYGQNELKKLKKAIKNYQKNTLSDDQKLANKWEKNYYDLTEEQKTELQAFLATRGFEDSDGDGVPDVLETAFGYSACDEDSDDDGIEDGEEEDEDDESSSSSDDGSSSSDDGSSSSDD